MGLRAERASCPWARPDAPSDLDLPSRARTRSKPPSGLPFLAGAWVAFRCRSRTVAWQDAAMGPKREALRDVGLAWLRVLAGVLIATHGYGKLFSGAMPDFVTTVAAMGLPGEPATLAHLAAWAEFAGGILC